MRPRLRPVEVFMARSKRGTVLCLRDPQGFNPNTVALAPSAGLVLECLDGEHSLRDIQVKIARHTGEIVSLETLEKFVAQLDDALMLDSPRFAEHRAQELRQYREAPRRPPAHAGRSYPKTPVGIRRVFARHFQPPEGPGTDGVRSKVPDALVLPHIDLRCGGPTFAWGYAQLGEAPPVDTFLIWGVAHQATTNRFIATRKDFETPLGVMETDREFLDELAGRLSFDLFEDELVHRREHSIEFQVVYLQYVLRQAGAYRIVPLLTGSFHDLLEDGKDPMRDVQVAEFVRALRATLSAAGRRVCVLASVDLAHVGGRFGDTFTVNDEVCRHLETEDRRMLSLVEACDAEAVLRFVYEEADQRRVDAWPTLYTLLRVGEYSDGRLLKYAQNFEPDTNSVVTFASLRLDK